MRERLRIKYEILTPKTCPENLPGCTVAHYDMEVREVVLEGQELVEKNDMTLAQIVNQMHEDNK